MIRTRNIVPDVYYNQSRDFQFLGRVFEVLFNYSKMNVDLAKENQLSNNSEDSLVNLLTKTLGFETKHQYNTQDLKAICGVFNSLIRQKGSIIAIENACKTLMSVQNKDAILVVDDEEVEHERTHVLDIYVPAELTDLILLEDLFDYILPAGYDYRFIKSAYSPSAESMLGTSSAIKLGLVPNKNIYKITIPGETDRKPVEVFTDNTSDNSNEEFGLTTTSRIVGNVSEED